jgi:hypothetical protein
MCSNDVTSCHRRAEEGVGLLLGYVPALVACSPLCVASHYF